MILLRERPPLLETPFEVFDKGVFTPNDQFFVRWHLPVIPTSIDVDTFRLRVDGHVRNPAEFTISEILHQPEIELAAVNQCSGNSRGLVVAARTGRRVGQWCDGQCFVDRSYLEVNPRSRGRVAWRGGGALQRS
jgi:DMSO/TMAO reductase YedYZ molybdopterin-dependent catalytic subunit